jgi:hypothetical protein
MKSSSGDYSSTCYQVGVRVKSDFKDQYCRSILYIQYILGNADVVCVETPRMTIRQEEQENEQKKESYQLRNKIVLHNENISVQKN